MPREKSQKLHEQPNPPERRSERLSARRSDPVATPPPAAPRGSLGASSGRLTSPASPEAAALHTSTADHQSAENPPERQSVSSSAQLAASATFSPAQANAALQAILATLGPSAFAAAAQATMQSAVPAVGVEPITVADHTAMPGPVGDLFRPSAGNSSPCGDLALEEQLEADADAAVDEHVRIFSPTSAADARGALLAAQEAAEQVDADARA